MEVLAAPKVPQVPPKRRHPRNKVTLWDTFCCQFWEKIVCLGCKNMVLHNVTVFIQFWHLLRRSKECSHMQSVHAGAVQTHFSIFAFILRMVAKGHRIGPGLEAVLGQIG